MELIDGKYKQEELLGTGAFSEVWKVTYVQTGVTLAMKIYKPNASMDNDGVKMLTHEYALMVNLNHRNLLKPQFFDVYDGRPYLILPFCEKGNINNMIGKLTEDEAWKLLRDTASALDYLHTRKPPIIHQDIKPANILVADDGTYMLTDFGVSTSLKATLSRLSIDEQSLMSAGTLAYMDPMKFSRKNLPIMANDIWSLGATVFEMLTGELPFGNSGGLLQKKGAEVPDIPDTFSAHLNDVLRSCMDEDPAKRPWASKLHEIAREAILHPEVRNKKTVEEVQVIDLKPASDNIQPGTEPISRPTPDPDMEKTQLIDNQPSVIYNDHYTNSLSTTASSESSNSLVWPWIITGIIGGTLVGVLLAYFI
jgi:serine/threonine protein kinase